MLVEMMETPLGIEKKVTAGVHVAKASVLFAIDSFARVYDSH